MTSFGGFAPSRLVIQRSHSVRASLITTIPLILLLAMIYPGTVAADPLFGAKTDFVTGINPSSVGIRDLNADGKPDLVVVNDGAGTVSVLLGNGDGTFGAKTDFTGGYGSLAIADVNVDGKPDLVVAGYPTGGAVSVLLGNGDGSFEPPTYHSVSVYSDLSRVVAVGDLDGDHKPDVAVPGTCHPFGCFGGGWVSVLLGKGHGSFGSPTIFPTYDNSESVAIADLNADGKLDLATGNWCHSECPGGSVSVLLGNGDGSFGAHTDYFTGAYYLPWSMAIGDVNADGKPDLVTTSAGVAVLLGNGDGSFGVSTDFGAGGAPRSVAIGDLNADGKPDLTTANDNSNTVSVLLGNGDGTFASHTDFGAGNGARSVTIGDLNGDSKPDLAVANYSSSTVSVLLNIGPHPATPVSLDLAPNTLNLGSLGHWVAAILEPQPPASPGDIDIASILLNGSVPVDASAPTSIGDADNDGRPDLAVKFDRAAVDLAVEEGEAVTVTVTGEIGGGRFEATDVIRVIREHVTVPSAGTMLQGGSVTEVRWETPTGVQIISVALLWSSDDGASWTLVARDLPNSGSYLWTVPSASTDQARLAVVLVESADESGVEVGGVLGMSERFVITTPVGVSEPRLELALRGLVPNPSKHLNVSFTLANANPATLVVYDVNGREVSRREVGGLGAGGHVLTLGAARTLAPGIYLVQLIQGDRRLVARGVVVRQ
jgi:VCBS repeat protein/Ser-Thr-rich glycosyl-phosphatidyl-inositol-anchored membrane family protein/FG-GAP repeat protein